MFTLHPRELPLPHQWRVELGARPVGTEIDYQLPLRTHVEIVTVHISFVTDANVANRYMRLEVGGIIDPDFASIIVPAMTAGITYNIWWGRGMGFQSTTFSNFRFNAPLPVGALWQYPDRIRTVTDNIQVGDQITAFRLKGYMWQDPVVL